MISLRFPPTLLQAWDASRPSQRATTITVAFIGMLVVAMLVAVVPLRDADEHARENLAHTRPVADVARARLAENAALARSAAPTGHQDLRTAIDKALSAQGIRYVPMSASSTEPVLRIVVESASFDALVRALEALARDDGVRVVDGVFDARVEPGTVRAELALAQ